MADAVMTWERAGNGEVPCCPHCKAQMHDAVISLGSLNSAWPLPARVTVEDDGYAYVDEWSAVVSCLECMKPSALAVDGGIWKLVACRTEKDRELKTGRRTLPAEVVA